MENDTKILDLRRPLLFSVGFIALVGILIWLGTMASNKRRALVYAQYAQETEGYIARHRNELTTLFAHVFPNQPCEATASATTQPKTPCPSNEAISGLALAELKDSSSTLFIKLRGGQLLSMRLSGETYPFSPAWPEPEKKEKEIRGLLEGKVESISWDDYGNAFPGKEVLIPVKDENGKILGAIMRGVIE